MRSPEQIAQQNEAETSFSFLTLSLRKQRLVWLFVKSIERGLGVELESKLT